MWCCGCVLCRLMSETFHFACLLTAATVLPCMCVIGPSLVTWIYVWTWEGWVCHVIFCRVVQINLATHHWVKHVPCISCDNVAACLKEQIHNWHHLALFQSNWCDPVCCSCNLSEWSWSHCFVWLISATVNWVTPQCVRFWWNEVSWDKIRWVVMIAA